MLLASSSFCFCYCATSSSPSSSLGCYWCCSSFNPANTTAELHRKQVNGCAAFGVHVNFGTRCNCLCVRELRHRRLARAS